MDPKCPSCGGQLQKGILQGRFTIFWKPLNNIKGKSVDAYNCIQCNSVTLKSRDAEFFSERFRSNNLTKKQNVFILAMVLAPLLILFAVIIITAITDTI